jgi:hypothetical protein
LRLVLIGLSGPQGALVVHYQNRDTAPLELVDAVPEEVYYHRPLQSITFEGHPQAVEGDHPDPQLIYRFQDKREHLREPKPRSPQVMEIIGDLDTHSLGYTLRPGSLLLLECQGRKIEEDLGKKETKDYMVRTFEEVMKSE